MIMAVQITVQRIRQAVNTLQLKRCVGDIIAVKNNLVDLALDVHTCTDGKVVGKDMGGHGTQILREAPDMEIVNTKHTFDLDNVLHQLFDIYIARRGFEQDVHCITQEAPGVVKNQEADHHTHERIKPVGIREINDNTRDDPPTVDITSPTRCTHVERRLR